MGKATETLPGMEARGEEPGLFYLFNNQRTDCNEQVKRREVSASMLHVVTQVHNGCKVSQKGMEMFEREDRSSIPISRRRKMFRVRLFSETMPMAGRVGVGKGSEMPAGGNMGQVMHRM